MNITFGIFSLADALLMHAVVDIFFAGKDEHELGLMLLKECECINETSKIFVGGRATDVHDVGFVGYRPVRFATFGQFIQAASIG